MTPRPTRSATAVAGLAALTLFGVTACGGSQSAAGTDGKIVVVASTNVWAGVAQAVGGDAVAVRAILSDAAADPHGYEARPADATAFTGAKLVLSNGGGYDDFFPGLVENAGPGVRQVVAFDVSGKGGEPEAHEGDEAGHDEAGHDHGVNEHVWYDLPTVRKVADRIATDLGEIAPERADAFRANATAFGGELDKLSTKAAGIGQAKPGATVLATEPVAHYLLDAAGLTDVTPPEFAEAIEEETDPSAAAVAATDELVATGKVSVVVYNSQTETPVTLQLKQKATAAGLPVIGVTETLPADATGYLDWMRKQVDSLAGALTAP